MKMTYNWPLERILVRWRNKCEKMYTKEKESTKIQKGMPMGREGRTDEAMS